MVPSGVCAPVSLIFVACLLGCLEPKRLSVLGEGQAPAQDGSSWGLYKSLSCTWMMPSLISGPGSHCGMRLLSPGAKGTD